MAEDWINYYESLLGYKQLFNEIIYILLYFHYKLFKDKIYIQSFCFF